MAQQYNIYKYTHYIGLQAGVNVSDRCI